MSQNSHDGLDLTDPLGIWRTWRDTNLDAWAKGMSNIVTTDAFAQAMGAQINAYLATSAPLQKFVEQYMESYLGRLNMPSRSEVVGLSQRLTNLEMRLDDLDAKTDQMMHALRAQAPVIVELLSEKLTQPITTTDEKGVAQLENQLKALDERTSQLLNMVEQLQSGMTSASVAARSRPRKAQPTVVEEVGPTEAPTAEDRMLKGFNGSNE
ncbi:MAG: hypothetical protein MUD01_08225 [Chloroflexaceae bacterium]|jgi:polyhydroxyalkanoate synthesis regulator phasin|nr:hypothetical protein [Chloroflexaceae bacterium]